MSNVINLDARRPVAPVPNAKPVYIDGKHCGGLMPQVRQFHNAATARAVRARQATRED